MTKLILVLFLILMITFMQTTKISANTTTPTPTPDQILLLLRIKHSPSFVDPLNSLDDWLNSTNPCTNWTGISCLTTTNKVVSIDLSSLGIQGPFPSDFCRNIPSLRYLNLGDNYFFGQLTSDSISPCSRLVSLNLSTNDFVGNFPDFPVRFPYLTTLDLTSNNFSGDIPFTFLNLPRIRFISLVANLFNGTSFPDFLTNLTTLTHLWLAWNPYRPTFLPSNIGRLTKLHELWATSSNLVGPIPDSVGLLRHVTNFDVSQNRLTGPIPVTIGNMTSAVQIQLWRNRLSGPLPDTFSNLASLLSLDASQNNLSGNIPETLASLTALESLALNSNFLDGEIPDALARSPSLSTLILFNNTLTGKVPPSLGSHAAMRILDVAGNGLDGPLPANVCAGKNLELLSLSNNRFSGRIPDSYGECGTLNRARMHGNELSGPVPEALWGLGELEFLDLAGNALQGSLPPSISGAKALKQLLISGNNFSGRLPTGVCDLPELVKLYVAGNRFSGELPSCVGRLSALQELHMSGNDFTGEIPRSVSGLLNLTQLDMSGNRLSGNIPADLGVLPLSYLNVSGNELVGEIPTELTKLKLTVFDVSNNRLTGQVPSGFDTKTFVSGLMGNPGLCSFNLDPIPRCSTPKHSRKHKSYSLVGILSGLGLLIVFAALFFLLLMKNKKVRIRFGRKRPQTWKVTAFQTVASMDEEDVLASLKAENVIGSGGSGCVYRVVLKNGQTVAAKKLWEAKRSSEPEEAFRAEVETMGGIRHVNIAKLLFTCISEDYMILVYEYMENGSLGDVLHDLEGGGPTLDWPKRSAIASGMAQGLAYLHHDCVPPIMHRDLKSNNVLLDEDFRPKVADFGLAKLLKPDDQDQVMSRVAGSYGYIAPEYGYTMKVSEKSDVYSFGVVLIELITGKRPNDSFFDENNSIVKWAREIALPKKRGRGEQDDRNNASLNRMLDSRMNVDTVDYPEVRKILNLALLCTAESPARRPSMRRVLELLNKRQIPLY